MRVKGLLETSQANLHIERSHRTVSSLQRATATTKYSPGMIQLIYQCYVDRDNPQAATSYNANIISSVSQSNKKEQSTSKKRTMTSSELEDIEFAKRMRFALSKTEMKVCMDSMMHIYGLDHAFNCIKALTIRISERVMAVDEIGHTKVRTYMIFDIRTYTHTAYQDNLISSMNQWEHMAQEAKKSCMRYLQEWSINSEDLEYLHGQR